MNTYDLCIYVYLFIYSVSLNVSFISVLFLSLLVGLRTLHFFCVCKYHFIWCYLFFSSNCFLLLQNAMLAFPAVLEPHVSSRNDITKALSHYWSLVSTYKQFSTGFKNNFIE